MRRQSHARRVPLSFSPPATGPTIDTLTFEVSQAENEGTPGEFTVTATITNPPADPHYVWPTGDAVGAFPGPDTCHYSPQLPGDNVEIICIALSADNSTILAYGFTTHTVTA